MKTSPIRRSALAAAVAALAFGTLCSSAFAQDIKERTLKFATQNPKGHPIVMGMEKFAETVAAKSGGKIKVNLFPGGVLGGDAPNISALQGGTIEMVVMNAGILAQQVKDFEVFDFPFMFATPQESAARCSTSSTRRTSMAWPIGSWAFATSPTASGRSRRSTTSPA
jgi:TRAP-type C4-dicarboxylate transport system substrate-binding protein